MQQMEIWLVILFLSKSKFYARQLMPSDFSVSDRDARGFPMREVFAGSMNRA